jgi:hypothetical protein
MGFGQSVRKLVSKFIPKRATTVTHATVPFNPEPAHRVGRSHHGHTMPHNWWLRRRSRFRTTRESRRRNRG